MPRLALGPRTERLSELMSRIDCRGGHTQIAKILAHVRRENDKARIGALVFIGDAMEEALDDLCAGAGELGVRNVPAFMFQEGYDPVCEQAFREIAHLTHGAYCRFTPGAPHEWVSFARGRGLCRGRNDSACRLKAGTMWRGQADRAAEVAMPALLLGVVVLILLFGRSTPSPRRIRADRAPVALHGRRRRADLCRVPSVSR